MKKLLFACSVLVCSFAASQVQEGIKNAERPLTVKAMPPSPPLTRAVEYSTISTNQIYTAVTEIAEFPGGINAFRSQVANNMNTRKLKGIGLHSSEATFVIEKDGTLSNLKAQGINAAFNEEVKNAIAKIKTTWKSAKIDGMPVRYRFRLPVKMHFEQ